VVWPYWHAPDEQKSWGFPSNTAEMRSAIQAQADTAVTSKSLLLLRIVGVMPVENAQRKSRKGFATSFVPSHIYATGP
jgi:hypothetical protein